MVVNRLLGLVALYLDRLLAILPVDAEVDDSSLEDGGILFMILYSFAVARTSFFFADVSSNALRCCDVLVGGREAYVGLDELLWLGRRFAFLETRDCSELAKTRHGISCS